MFIFLTIAAAFAVAAIVATVMSSNRDTGPKFAYDPTEAIKLSNLAVKQPTRMPPNGSRFRHKSKTYVVQNGRPMLAKDDGSFTLVDYAIMWMILSSGDTEFIDDSGSVIDRPEFVEHSDLNVEAAEHHDSPWEADTQSHESSHSSHTHDDNPVHHESPVHHSHDHSSYDSGHHSSYDSGHHSSYDSGSSCDSGGCGGCGGD